MRYIIGIDLGTTNSSVAFVDRQKPPFAIQLFSIPQLTAAGKIDYLFSLPSFCYLIAKEEWPPKALQLPWKEETHTFVGQLAKTQGARVPTRLIQSAKSWLCNVSANRREKILPINAADLSQRLSPVEATAKYLMHIREAWNAVMAKGNTESEFEEQEIVLTVPASFDEVARTLTIEACRLAGFNHFTLLEEPQAAFYSWIAQHEADWQTILKAQDSILVCDVGGGTTDFSLIEVHEKDQQLTFQRMAVGDHLLLGGDNMDALLSYHLETQLQDKGYASLESTQWLQLHAEARLAKEKLLGQEEDFYSVVLQGSGSSVVGGSLATHLTKEEVEKLLLEGFFGQYDKEQAVQLQKSRGFRTMGLPYEDEPSITKHLAHFLKQAHYLEKGVDFVLFNGGTMKPQLFQEAIYQSLCRWIPHKKPTILNSYSLDLAVARGAAYYGKVKKGLGVAIGGGIPRTYYLEVDVKTETGEVEKKALTLLPRGSEEGASFQPQQLFLLRPNTPVSFHLLTSHVRLKDAQGSLISIDEQDMQYLPPIQTILRFGRKQLTGEEQKELLPVKLGVQLTAIGTVEIWLESQKTEHRWNLEFQLRTASGQDNYSAQSLQQQDQTFEITYLKEAQQMIEELFSSSSKIKPSQIIEKLENVLEISRKDWPSSVLRSFWDSLLKVATQRKLSQEHEVRWWNLVGFCLRPGFGYPLDDFRIKELWKIILGELKLVKPIECQIQKWICYRRIAGGLNKGQQIQLASELTNALFNKNGKIELKNKSDAYAYSEKIRALGSFERVDLPLKTRLAEAILNRIKQKEALAADYWALARIGARHLIYGSAGQVVPKDVCVKWVEQILSFADNENEHIPFVLGQLARKTDHRELNLPEYVINKILEQDLNGHLKEMILHYRVLSENEQEQVFGDRLPAGLMLEI